MPLILVVGVLVVVVVVGLRKRGAVGCSDGEWIGMSQRRGEFKEEQ